MRTKWLLPLILIFVFLLLAMIPQKDARATCRTFLADCGYRTEGTPEAMSVRLPEKADDVWEAYLLLQKKSGFDMAPYAGSTVMKYTFRVLNYPGDGFVYANVYWADGQIIGGDIMSPALDGFMHGLRDDLL